MIQRKQTLFLLVATLLLALACFSPLYAASSPEFSIVVKAFGTTIIQGEDIAELNTIYLGLNIVFVLVLTVLAIVKFSNRPLQKKLCLLSLFIVVANAGALHTLVLSGIKTTLAVDSLNGSIGLGYYFMVATSVFYLLAYVFINKDDKLVKSVDRLR